MRFVRFDGDRLGLLSGEDGVVDLTDTFDVAGPDPLRDFIRAGYDASDHVDDEPDHALDDVRLEAPIRFPRKVVAAPSNYAEHIAEMSGSPIAPAGYFLKAPSSIVGPADGIELPFADRRCDHEVELAFVMGETVKDIDRGDVLDAVFGYTVLLDISLRGDEDRSQRKSYDSFTVIGPAVATPDELPSLDALDLHLGVNGEVRQDATTEHMIYPPAEIVEAASYATTIHAGDVVATGTPSGVGPLEGGDTIEAGIEGIGEMTVEVTQRDAAYDDVKIHKGE